MGTLPEAEGVSTHKVSTLTVWVVQGVEEERGGWAEEVLDVLLKSIDILASWVLGNLNDTQRYLVSAKNRRHATMLLVQITASAHSDGKIYNSITLLDITANVSVSHRP